MAIKTYTFVIPKTCRFCENLVTTVVTYRRFRAFSTSSNRMDFVCEYHAKHYPFNDEAV